MERGTIVFIRKSGSSGKGEFITGTVVRGGEKSIGVNFDDECKLTPKQEVIFHYKKDDEFLQQSYRVSSVVKVDRADRRYQLIAEGEPESGDIRSSERVATVYEPFLARFGGEKNCVVLDISEHSIAVIAGDKHAVGDDVEFEMWIRDGQFLGIVRICSVAPARRDKFRYGLSCNPDGPDHNLQRSLQRLWVALQIKYLEMMV